MSGMLHDFSISSISELEKIAIDGVDNEEQWGFFDWFDDAFAEKLNIKENLNDLKHYHEEMMDKYNIGKDKLKSIIKDVTFVDDQHANIWDQINDELTLYKTKIEILTKTISPSNLAYNSSENLKVFLNKLDESYKESFEATEANIKLLNQYIEQELYPPEWWESLLSGTEGFLVSTVRNIVFEPLLSVLEMFELHELSRNGIANLDNIEAWLREITFDENAYLTGSKLGEVTSIIVGIYELFQGASMVLSGVIGGVSGGLLAASGVGAPIGGATLVASGELIFAGIGVAYMGAVTAGSGYENFKEPIEDTSIDLEELQDVDTSLGEGASGAGKNIIDKASINGKRIGDMNKQEIINSIPDDWEVFENNGFVHIKDEKGITRIRIDPPDEIGTLIDHIHIYDENKKPLDINGNIRSKKEKEVHIPLRKD